MAVLVRVLLLVNPASRVGSRRKERAAEAFARAGVPCDVIVTDTAGQAGAIARARARDYHSIFSLGGDGTAMEIISALAGAISSCPVGILAGGTGNLLARTLGIPLDVRRAVPALLRGTSMRVDLGRLADGRRFAFAAGVGIDSRMIEGAPESLKRRLGIAAYMLAAGRAIVRRENFHVRATVDGVVHEREAVSVMVANFGAVLNRLITLGPNIRQDDGLLDLCIFSPRTLLESVRVLWRLYRNDFRSDPCMLYASGRIFRIETDPPRKAEADGEIIGETPLAIHVEPLAATLLVPAAN